MADAMKQQPVVEAVELDQLDDVTGDERVDKARRVFKEALVKMALHSDSHRDGRNRLGVSSVIQYELASMSVIELVDEGIDTMCLELKGDGVMRLRANIDFVANEGVQVTMFGLTHEIMHAMMIIWDRKANGEIGFLADYMGDPLFKSQALEYWINWRVMKLYGLKAMVDVGDRGEPLGLMDPLKAYASVRKHLGDQGPANIEAFLSTPETCYSWLKRLPKPPKQRHSDFCNHDRGEQGGGSGGDGQGSSVDPDEMEHIIDQVLDSVMGRALRGDEAARESLLDFGEVLGGEGSKFWSDFGLGQLLGKKLPPMKVRLWEAFLTNVLGSMLSDGCRIEWPKKLAGADPVFRGVGSGIPLMAIGKEPEKKVWIFYDTSGSIPREMVDRMAAVTGRVDGCEIKYHSFTTEVIPMDSLDEFKYASGGTSFHCIDEYVMAQDELPDSIIIVTDGYAPEIIPSWAHLAIWVVTEDGSPWMRDHGMETVVTDIPKVS